MRFPELNNFNEIPRVKIYKSSLFYIFQNPFLGWGAATFPLVYQFHTKVAKHYFCIICGIYTHHNPRSNPAMTGFNLGCIDEIDIFDLKNIGVNDGKNHPLDKK